MSVTTSLSDVLPAGSLPGNAVEGPWVRAGAEPEAVVHPASVEEVAATLRWAHAAEVRVVPLASGDRRQGDWPEGRFVVLSTRRLEGIEVYEPADLTLTARSGTPMEDIDAALRPHGQWLPFDPPHVAARSLGGLVATGASGPLWMGYGALRNHVLGATVVTGDGRPLELGGRVVKNVAGFDLLKPVIGSRGRLGVLTSVCVRTFPIPVVDRLLVLRRDTATALADAAMAICTAPVMPVSSVLVAPAVGLGAGAALIVRLHGAEATVSADRHTLERHVGSSFDVVSDPTVAAAAGDGATRGEVGIHLSAPPSALADVVGALSDVPGAELVADTYAAAVRVSLTDLDTDAWARLSGRVVAAGGAATVVRGPESLEHRVAPPPHEWVGELGERLTQVFDPGGILWRPTR